MPMMCKMLWRIQEPSVCQGLRLGEPLASDGIEASPQGWKRFCQSGLEKRRPLWRCNNLSREKEAGRQGRTCPVPKV